MASGDLRGIERSACPARYHGTTSAYTAHKCGCPEAKAEWRRYRTRRELGTQPPGWVDATGTHRRIQAMQAMGYSQRALAARLGCRTKNAVSKLLGRPRVHRRTAEAVERLCDELGMSWGDSQEIATRSRRRGWVSILAWEGVDIDDPAAEPILDADTGGGPDHAAVFRAMTGRISADQLRTEDRLAAVEHLSRANVPARRCSELLGVSTRAIQRYRARLGLGRERQPATGCAS